MHCSLFCNKPNVFMPFVSPNMHGRNCSCASRADRAPASGGGTSFIIWRRKGRPTTCNHKNEKRWNFSCDRMCIYAFDKDDASFLLGPNKMITKAPMYNRVVMTAKTAKIHAHR